MATADRTLHTDTSLPFDLTAAKQAVGEEPLQTVATKAADAARAYLTARGFIDEGTIQPLDPVYLAAAELRHVADTIRRSLRPDEDAEWYLLSLLRDGASGDRPPEVPPALTQAHGLAAVTAASSYRRDLAQWLRSNPDADAKRVLGRLRDHERRVNALDGDVSVADADRLVDAAQAVGTYLRTGDATELIRARELFAELER